MRGEESRFMRFPYEGGKVLDDRRRVVRTTGDGRASSI
jgi:hypothetical protein